MEGVNEVTGKRWVILSLKGEHSAIALDGTEIELGIFLTEFDEFGRVRYGTLHKTTEFPLRNGSVKALGGTRSSSFEFKNGALYTVRLAEDQVLLFESGERLLVPKFSRIYLNEAGKVEKTEM